LHIGWVHNLRGDDAQAAIHLGRAKEILAKEKAKEASVLTAHVLNYLGLMRFRQHRYWQALSLKRKALAALSSVPEAETSNAFVRAAILQNIGDTQLALHRPTLAVSSLEASVALREHSQGDPLDLADMRFSLAKALWKLGREKARALSLARQALEDFKTAEPFPPVKKKSAEINAWLKAHAPGGERGSFRVSRAKSGDSKSL